MLITFFFLQVMKLLGVKKSALNRYPSNDPRVNRRRLCGSVSSLPSSVSSRPIRDRHRRPEDRKKFVRDIKVIFFLERLNERREASEYNKRTRQFTFYKLKHFPEKFSQNLIFTDIWLILICKKNFKEKQPQSWVFPWR